MRGLDLLAWTADGFRLSGCCGPWGFSGLWLIELVSLKNGSVSVWPMIRVSSPRWAAAVRPSPRQSKYVADAFAP